MSAKLITSPITPREDIRFGILFMLAYSLFALITDTLAKKLIVDITIYQVVWARFVFHSIALFIFFGPKKFFKLSKTKNFNLQIIRSLLMIVTAFFFFSGIDIIGLATAHSIFFLTCLNVLTHVVFAEIQEPRHI